MDFTGRRGRQPTVAMPMAALRRPLGQNDSGAQRLGHNDGSTEMMDPTRYSMSEVVRHWAARQPGRPALRGETETLTYGQWDAVAERVCARMRDRGVCGGDRVLCLGRNRASHPVLMAAASRARAAMVGANWRLAPRELGYLIGNADPKIAFAEREFAAVLNEALPSGIAQPPVVELSGVDGFDDLRSWSAAGTQASSGASTPRPDDIAALNYTSGTTGEPKGVVITNAQLGAAAARPAPWVLGQDTVHLLASPLFHASGMAWLATVSYAGGSVVPLPDADPTLVAAAIAHHRVTDAMLVPALIKMLMDDPRVEQASFASLRFLAYGASPIPQPVLQRMRTFFGGVELGQGYGLSETVGPITYLTAEDHRAGGRRLASAGRAAEGVELRIVDPDSCEEVGVGQPGEVWTRSTQNCCFFFRDTTDTENLFCDGWLRTGDLGRVEDGYLYLSDRLKDMIVTAGENVYATEVESVLVEIADVAEACVVGVPDERWGETVAAAIVVAPGASLDARRIIEECRANLAHYKCPTRVWLAAGLPRNATGKVMRTEVRRHFAQFS